MTILTLTISNQTVVITGDNLAVTVGGEHDFNSSANVAVPTESPETANPQAPRAVSGNRSNPIHPDPHNPQVDDGQPDPSSNADGAKSDVPHIVGQGGLAPVDHCVEFEQQPADEPQDRNEPIPGKAASVTNSNPITVLRPLCQSPDECAGYGSHTCHRCLKAAESAGRAA